MLPLYNEKNQLIKNISKYQINDADMGESSISADVVFDGVVNFHPDWYLSDNGEKYILGVRKPTGRDNTDRIATTYSLVFKSEREDLKRYTYMDFVELGTGNRQPASSVVPIRATLTEFVHRFNVNLRYYTGTRWLMTLPEDYVESGKIMTFTFENASLWDVLIKTWEFYGVRWFITPFFGDTLAIKVAEPAVEVEHIFEVGAGNGLISVERNNPLERIITRLRGRGSERNLPRRYFKTASSLFKGDPDSNPDLATAYYKNLMPKVYRDYVRGYNAGSGSGNWAYNKGVADKKSGNPIAPVDYSLSDKENLWGISYGAIEPNDKIYPTLQGAERPGIGRVDEIIAVEQILVDAPVKDENGKPSGPFKLPIGDINFTGSSQAGAVQTASKKTEDLDITKAVNKISAKFTMAARSTYGDTTPEIVDIGSNVISTSLVVKLINSDTGGVMTSWTYSNRAEADLVWENVAVGKYHIRYELTWSASKKKYIRPAPFIVPELKDVPTELNVSIAPSSYTVYDSEASKQGYQDRWSVWIKDPWGVARNAGESDTAYALRVWRDLATSTDEGEMTMMFSDGLLAGEDYEFKLIGIRNERDELVSVNVYPDESKTYNGQKSAWRIELQKSDAEFDASEKYLPNTMVNAKPGDHFFFIHIQMPYDPYVYHAEDRVQAWMDEELAKLDEEFPSFTISPSRIFCASFPEADKIKAGAKIRLRNTNLIGSSYTTLHVKSVTKNYTGDKMNPDWTVDISDEIIPTGNPLQILEGSVEKLSSNVYSNKEAVAQAVKALQSSFVRKDGMPDTSYSPTTFKKPVVIGQEGIRDENFKEGDLSGAGAGIYTDGNGNRVVEADIIVARKTARFNEVQINEVTYTGGKQVFSAAGLVVSDVEDITGGFRLYFDTKQGSVVNKFALRDGAFCQRFVESGVKYYWARVIGLGGNYIDISTSDKSGEVLPTKGDNIAQLGNDTDTSRQAAFIIDVVRDGGGLVTWYDDITEFTLNEKDSVNIGRIGGKTWLQVFGSSYVGKRDKSEYIQYDEGKVDIKGAVTITGGETRKEIDQAKLDIQSAAKAATDASKAVGDLNTYVDGAFSDGIISESEAKAIEKYINIVNNEIGNIESAYTALYSNIYLSGVPKDNLATSKTAVVAAANRLLSSINTAIVDGKTTPEEKADVDAKYAEFTAASSLFSTRVEEANKAIQDALKVFSDNAQDTADSLKYLGDAMTKGSFGVYGGLALGNVIGVTDVGQGGDVTKIQSFMSGISSNLVYFGADDTNAYNRCVSFAGIDDPYSVPEADRPAWCVYKSKKDGKIKVFIKEIDLALLDKAATVHTHAGQLIRPLTLVIPKTAPVGMSAGEYGLYGNPGRNLDLSIFQKIRYDETSDSVIFDCGLVSNKFVSARGVDSSGGGGGGGLDVQRMWEELRTSGADQIDKSHITTALTGYATESWANGQYILKSAIGSNGGVAPIGSDGKIGTQYLPSYVDDVLEFASVSGFPATGESGKIYVAIDTNLTYRWSGSGYVEISPSLALGETSSTAYRGDRGKIAYDHSQVSGNPHSTVFSQIGGMLDMSKVTGLVVALNNKLETSIFDSFKLADTTWKNDTAEAFNALSRRVTTLEDYFEIVDGHIHVKNGRGFYSDSFVSARGLDASSGGGGGGINSLVVKLGSVSYTGVGELDVVVSLPAYPTTLPASDVPSWAKQASKPTYTFAEIGGKPTTLSGYGITDGVLSSDYRLTNARPASDVSSWAKQASKPVYSYSEITGLQGQLDNKVGLNGAGASGQWNINSATTNRLKSRAIGTSYNLNSIMVGGGALYNYSATTWWVNGPIGVNYGSCFQFNSIDTDDLALQIIADINHNSVNSTKDIWFRMSNNLGFQSDWKKLWHSGNSNKADVNWSCNNSNINGKLRAGVESADYHELYSYQSSYGILRLHSSTAEASIGYAPANAIGSGWTVGAGIGGGRNFGFYTNEYSATRMWLNNQGEGLYLETGWYRSYGAVGWYNQTYNGGIRMTGTTWIETYGGKGFLVDSLDGIRIEGASANAGNHILMSNPYGHLWGIRNGWNSVDQNYLTFIDKSINGDGNPTMAISSEYIQLRRDVLATARVSINGASTNEALNVNGWVRTEGNTGIYFGSYGGGLYMLDTVYVRVYNSKRFYSPAGYLNESPGLSWIDGQKTNSGVIFNNNQSNDASYHPVINTFSASCVMSYGRLNNLFGFFGSYLSKTENAYDATFHFNFDASEWYSLNIIHSGKGIYSDGYVSARGLDPNSDITLKKNITYITLQDAKEYIMGLNFFKHGWIDFDRETVSLSAQEVQRTKFEFLVHHLPSGKLTHDYKATHNLAIMVVQNHETRIEKLEREIERLKKNNYLCKN